MLPILQSMLQLTDLSVLNWFCNRNHVMCAFVPSLQIRVHALCGFYPFCRGVHLSDGHQGDSLSFLESRANNLPRFLLPGFPYIHNLCLKECTWRGGTGWCLIYNWSFILFLSSFQKAVLRNPSVSFIIVSDRSTFSRNLCLARQPAAFHYHSLSFSYSTIRVLGFHNVVVELRNLHLRCPNLPGWICGRTHSSPRSPCKYKLLVWHIAVQWKLCKGMFTPSVEEGVSIK